MQIAPIPALDPEVNDIRLRTADIVTKQIIPNERLLAVPGREAHEMRESIRADVKKEGLWAPHLPKEYGGMGIGFIKHAYMNEVLAWSPYSNHLFGVVAPNSGNQTILTGNFSNFQLLDYYRFSTNNTYLEAHYDHHFNGFFFDRVPLLRKLKWQEVASLNYLTTAQAGHYLELGAGVEHIFKVVRVDFYSALQSGQRLGTGLRIGVGF